MRSLRILMCVLVGAAPAFAQSGTIYDFLRLDVGARAAALNGSFVSMADDPNLLFYNPAALTSVTQPSASAGFLKHLLDVNSGNLVYSQSISDLGTFGAGILFVDYGSFDRTDESMNVLGSFGARELAIVIGGGREIAVNTSVGLTAKYVYSSIADFSSSAVAFDLGFYYEIPSEFITLGASVLNLGTQLSTYGGTSESLPVDVKIGITKRPEHLPVLLSLNFHKLNESEGSIFDRFSAFTFGAEFLMSESVRLRFGYSNEKRKELKVGTTSGLAGFSLGGGVRFDQYLVDYAFNSYGKIGALHRISIGMVF